MSITPRRENPSLFPTRKRELHCIRWIDRTSKINLDRKQQGQRIRRWPQTVKAFRRCRRGRSPSDLSLSSFSEKKPPAQPEAAFSPLHCFGIHTVTLQTFYNRRSLFLLSVLRGIVLFGKLTESIHCFKRRIPFLYQIFLKHACLNTPHFYVQTRV